MAHRQRIVVVVGPTAGGKSELAVRIAERFGGQIINADSMQVYRRLDAGTAKPTAAQRAAVVHHLIDIVEPTDSFTVADWLVRAEALIAELHTADALPIVAGGTNLYIKALLEGMFEGPPADEAFRRSLESVHEHELHRRLVEVDPAAAARIDRNDRKRIIRALEVYEATGQPISRMQQQWSESATPEYRHDPILIGLRWETEAINRRINARVKEMFHPPAGCEGLIEETRRLQAAGLLGHQARQAIGTKQVLEHLAGECTAEEAMEQVKIDTRRFAKAQRTWLKRYAGVHWLDVAAEQWESVVQQALEVVECERHPSPKS